MRQAKAPRPHHRLLMLAVGLAPAPRRALHPSQHLRAQLLTRPPLTDPLSIRVAANDSPAAIALPAASPTVR
jgi:hypothetical protein